MGHCVSKNSQSPSLLGYPLGQIIWNLSSSDSSLACITKHPAIIPVSFMSFNLLGTSIIMLGNVDELELVDFCFEVSCSKYHQKKSHVTPPYIE